MSERLSNWLEWISENPLTLLSFGFGIVLVLLLVMVAIENPTIDLGSLFSNETVSANLTPSVSVPPGGRVTSEGAVVDRYGQLVTVAPARSIRASDNPKFGELVTPNESSVHIWREGEAYTPAPCVPNSTAPACAPVSEVG